ncbi:MAG: hypothetical protein KDE15_06535 [Erythrobacter sp.]|nr:hypothetical protein [Erythrobacter sp.]
MATAAAGGGANERAAAYLRWHYPVGSALLLLLSLVAFGDNLFTDIHQPSNSDPKMVVHGLFALSWMVLLVVQKNLPRIGRISLHRQLGQSAFWVGAGTVLATLYLFYAVFRGWAVMGPDVLANRVMLPSFGIALLAAWKLRNRPDWHKRLVYCGTLFLLSPILSRVYDPVVAPFMPPYAPGEDDHLFFSYLVIVWAGFFAGQMAYDWLKDRRLHPITLGAFCWTALVNAGLYLA